MVATSLYQGEGAEDNLLYTGELGRYFFLFCMKSSFSSSLSLSPTHPPTPKGNYIFTGVGRPSTLWLDFENLSPPNFVMTVGIFSSLELTGKHPSLPPTQLFHPPTHPPTHPQTGTFTVDEKPFHIPQEGAKHSLPLLYTTNTSALDFATIRLNLGRSTHPPTHPPALLKKEPPTPFLSSIPPIPLLSTSLRSVLT